MKHQIWLIWACLIIGLSSLLACQSKKEDEQGSGPLMPEDIRALDISYYPESKFYNYNYRSAFGTEIDFWDLIRARGVNTVRMRVWNDGWHYSSSLASVVELSKVAKSRGFKVWIDFHYSDSWADPGNQVPPKNWQGIPFVSLQDSIFWFTSFGMQLIEADYVQIGNELNAGFLWPSGHISKEAEFLTLYRAGLKAVRNNRPKAKVILHFAGLKDATWFYSKFNAGDYDLAGLSYYPFWHGKDLSMVKTTLQEVKAIHGKSPLIAETAYPFTLLWKDQTHNVVGDSNQLIMGFPASPSGQANFLLGLQQLVKEIDGSGIGYWGGEWVAYKGDTATYGSSWENQAWWDFNGIATPISFAQ